MPRSPSRDLADRYQGNRAYFRRFNRIEKWKWGLSAAALVAAIGYVGAGFVMKRTGDYRMTHGPLTHVHATWDAQCDVCHKPTGEQDKTGLLRADKRWADLTCEKCHAGPPHYHGQEAADNACATCHHDHLGRANSLVKIGDDHCTKCHADPAIQQHARFPDPGQPPPPVLKPIRDFTAGGGHPNMRVLDAETMPDRGKPHERGLKFSHALHMSAGISYPGAAPSLTLKDVQGKAGWKQYEKYATDGGLLQLDCYACHQLDSGLQGKDIKRPTLKRDGSDSEALEELITGLPRYSLRPPRGNGDVFLPVSYDLHCKTCHPNVPNPDGKLTRVETYIDANLHRVQPAALFRDVQRQYYGLMFEKQPARETPAAAPKTGGAKPPPPAAFEEIVFDAPKSAPPKPTAADPRQAEFDSLKRQFEAAKSDKARADILAVQQTNAFLLYREDANKSNCTKCHIVDGFPTDLAPGLPADEVHKKLAGAKIRPTNTPSVWFANAKFNHAAHRGTTCVSCHPNVQIATNAYAGWATGATALDKAKSGAKMIQADENAKPSAHLPNIDECRKCHAPAGTKDGQPVGGVRHACVECHRYHNGEHPLQGRGAASRNPAAPYDSFPAFLGGKPASKTP